MSDESAKRLSNFRKWFPIIIAPPLLYVTFTAHYATYELWFNPTIARE